MAREQESALVIGLHLAITARFERCRAKVFKYWVGSLVFGTLLGGAEPVAALESDSDHGVVQLALEAMVEQEHSEHAHHIGPAVEIEVEAIEDRLEIEFGASTNRSERASDWDLDLQFKRPFKISSFLEIEPGLGPSWSLSTRSDRRPGTWGGEASVDLLFWRSKRLGWFLEPSYGWSFGNGTRTSIGLSGGIIFSLR